MPPPMKTSTLPRVLLDAMRREEIDLATQWDEQAMPKVLRDLADWAANTPEAPESVLRQIASLSGNRLDLLRRAPHGSRWQEILLESLSAEEQKVCRQEMVVSWAQAVLDTQDATHPWPGGLYDLLTRSPFKGKRELAQITPLHGHDKDAILMKACASLIRGETDVACTAWIAAHMPRSLVWRAIRNQDIPADEIKNSKIPWPPIKDGRAWSAIFRWVLSDAIMSHFVIEAVKERNPQGWEGYLSGLASRAPITGSRRDVSWHRIIDRDPSVLADLPLDAMDVLIQRWVNDPSKDAVAATVSMATVTNVPRDRQVAWMTAHLTTHLQALESGDMSWSFYRTGRGTVSVDLCRDVDLEWSSADLCRDVDLEWSSADPPTLAAAMEALVQVRERVRPGFFEKRLPRLTAMLEDRARKAVWGRPSPTPAKTSPPLADSSGAESRNKTGSRSP